MLQTRVLRSPTVACGLKLNSSDPKGRTIQPMGRVFGTKVQRDKTRQNQTKPDHNKHWRNSLGSLVFQSASTFPPNKKNTSSQPIPCSEKNKMTTAPYAQTKFADHEDSNLDSYSRVKGCPFFELAIGTSWRTFCFSTYAGSKDQLVATRESQLSEPTMTYQTHSNSLLYANHCISMPYILHGTSKCAFMTTVPLKATNVNERPCRHGPISVPKGNCCSFGSCFWDIFPKQHSMILCAHNLSLMLPAEQKTHISHPSSLLPPCGNSRASLGAGLP